MKATGKSRNRLDILAEILSLAAQEAMVKTRIMYRTRTTFVTLQDYLDELTRQHLLEPVVYEKHVVYRTTGRGRKFLEHFEELQKLLKEQPVMQQYAGGFNRA